MHGDVEEQRDHMVFDMYRGDWHVKAHGAVERPRKGNHGLMAGCAFEKMLKSCLGPIKWTKLHHTSGGMRDQLGAQKSALTRANVVLSDGKQHVPGSWWRLQRVRPWSSVRARTDMETGICS